MSMKPWETSLLKVQPLITLNTFVGKAGLHSLMNWATEIPDLVAMCQATAIWGRGGAKMAFKRAETVNPAVCSEWVHCNELVNWSLGNQATLSKQKPKLGTLCITAAKKWQIHFLGSKRDCDSCMLQTYWKEYILVGLLGFFKWTNIRNKYFFSLTTSYDEVLQIGFSEKTNLSRERAELNENVYRALVSLGDRFALFSGICYWYLSCHACVRFSLI